jgi:hypothetical protein
MEMCATLARHSLSIRLLVGHVRTLIATDTACKFTCLNQLTAIDARNCHSPSSFWHNLLSCFRRMDLRSWRRGRHTKNSHYHTVLQGGRGAFAGVAERTQAFSGAIETKAMNFMIINHSFLSLISSPVTYTQCIRNFNLSLPLLKINILTVFTPCNLRQRRDVSYHTN